MNASHASIRGIGSEFKLTVSSSSYIEAEKDYVERDTWMMNEERFTMDSQSLNASLVAVSSTLQLINTLEGACVPVVCTAGILGNVLTLAVLSQTRMRRSVSDRQEKLVMCSGLTALAAADLLVCACVLPRSLVPAHRVIFERGPGGSWPFGLLYQLYGTALVGTFSLVSTLLIVLMAAARYLAICHPLRSRSFGIARLFYAALTLVFPLSLLANLPAFWTFSACPMGNGSTLLYVDVGPFSHFHPRGRTYQWGRAVVALFLPAVLLTFFNVCLVRALRASQRLRRCHSLANGSTYRHAPSTSSNRLTVLLIAVIVSFVVLVYPCEMLDFLTHLTHLVRPNESALMLARSLASLLQVSNFAFNFALYSALNVQFRKTLRNMLCRWSPCSPPRRRRHSAESSEDEELTRPAQSLRLRCSSKCSDGKILHNNTMTTALATAL